MSKNRKIPDKSAGGSDRRREVVGVIGLGMAIFVLVAMVSLQAHAMVMGPFGRGVAGMFYGLAGVCGYFLIALGAVAAIRMLLVREPALPPLVAAGTVLAVVSLATLAHLIAPHYRVPTSSVPGAEHGPGGVIGEHLAEILRAVISTAGTALLAVVGLVVAVVVATPLRMRDVLHGIWSGVRAAAAGIRTAARATVKFWLDVLRAILPSRSDRDDDDDDEIVVEDDVLEVAAEETGPEPVIIERTQPSPIEVIELTEKKKEPKRK